MTDSIRPELDPLTGARTRTGLADALARVCDDAERSGKTVTAALLDIDYFKSINDAFGHRRGDEALRGLVERLQKTLRPEDVIFRLGGDEFLLLLPGTHEVVTESFARRLQTEISGQPLAGDPPLTLSVSIGMAGYPCDAISPSALLDEVDRRLLQSKRTRRGQIPIANESAEYSDAAEMDETKAALSPPRLIERDAVLFGARAFLQLRSSNQHPHNHNICLAIEAAPGMGGTRLLAEIATQGQLQGLAVWQMTGLAGRSKRAFGALDYAFKSLKAGNTPEAWYSALRHHLTSCNAALVLITVDRVDLLDDDSRAVLSKLCMQETTPPLAMILTAPNFEDEWFTHSECMMRTVDRMALSPLSDAGIKVWLRYVLRSEPSPDLVAQVRQYSSGVPSRIAEALAYWLAEGWIAAGRKIKDSTVLPPPLPAPQPPLYGEIAAIPASMLLDRRTELALLRRALSREHLAYICGADGHGKTRLAMQLAVELRESAPEVIPDGVIWCALPPNPSAADLARRTAEALGKPLPAGQDMIEALAELLAPLRALWVIDDLPHQGEVLSALARCIAGAEGLRTLIVSPLPPVLPSINGVALGGLDEDAGLRLFLSYVYQDDPTFSMNEADRGFIQTLVRQADGIPEVLQLTSAWVTRFGIEEVVNALRRDGKKSSPAADDLARAHLATDPALQPIFELLWEMFSQHEQDVLVSLSTFSGSFHVAAATHVANASPFFLDALAARRLLTRTLDGANATPRYRLNRTFGQFAAQAAERRADLQSDPEPSVPKSAAERLTEYYLQMLINHSFALETGRVSTESLKPDLDNVFAAWQGGLANDSALLEQASTPFFTLLIGLGYFHEAAAFVQEALNYEPPISARLRAGLQIVLGELSYHTGRYAEGMAPLQAAFAWMDEHGETSAAINAQRLQANLLGVQGRYDEALVLLQAGLAAAVPLYDDGVTFQLLNRCGVMAFHKKDYTAAGEYFERAGDLARAMRDLSKQAISLNNRGEVAMKCQQIDLAERLLHEGLAMAKPLGIHALQGSMLDSLGRLYTTQKSYAAAAATMIEALRLLQSIDAPPLAMEVLQNVARLLTEPTHQTALAQVLARTVVHSNAVTHDVRQQAQDLLADLSAGLDGEVLTLRRALAEAIVALTPLISAQT